MGVLEFLCDRIFHQSFTLPPDPTVGREKPYRFSYADFGDRRSNAVVLFCGALMATRFSYAPLDQLATKYNVRIIHPDRPGVGGSDPVELEKRIQTWLEIVPKLLEHLNIDHVSLASHSGGVIYLLNTMLTYPQLLHPKQPYACFFAPWVHPSHSKVVQMQVTELLPAPMIGKFATAAKFINDNVMPLSGFSSSLIEGSKSSFPLMAPRVAVPLDPGATSYPLPSGASEDAYCDLALDDPKVIEQLRGLITQYMFAERTDGISADAQLFMRKPRSISWGSPSMQWSDLDYFVPFFAKLLNEDSKVKSRQRIWVIDAVHAASDNMVGEKGRVWFDACWVPEGASTSNSERDVSSAEHQAPASPYEYTSSIVKETDHNFLMDPRFGASELWLRKVRDCSVT